MSENTGGPAFPIPGKVSHYDEGTFKDEAFAGMTLRDYFAAKALNCVPEQNAYNMQDSESFECYMARRAYRIADAMLAERDK